MELSGHVKVWRAYAEFEAAPMPMSAELRDDQGGEEEDEEKYVEGDVELARHVFERAYKDLKNCGLREEVRTVLTFGSLYVFGAY